MRCEELDVGTRWIDKVLGELPPELLLQMNDHLSGCAACRARQQETESDLKRIGGLPTGLEVRGEVFFAPPLDAPRRLPEALPEALPVDLEKRLLAIPGPVPKHTWWERIEALLGQWRDLRLFPTFRPFALGAAVTVMLIWGLMPRTEPALWKGQKDDASERQVQTRIRLELMIREGLQPIRRAHLEPLTGGSLGAVVPSEAWLQPVLMTQNIDLAGSPWYVSVMWHDATGSSRVLAHSAKPMPLERLPGTERSYVTRDPIRLTGLPSGAQGRLFVLVTQSLLDPQVLIDAASTLHSTTLRPGSLLETPALLELTGYEGSLHIEVR